MVAAFAAMLVGVVGSWPSASPYGEKDVALTMAQARLSNAAVPIERSRRVRARPYRFRGGEAARAQAVDCLATAALYEAGDDRRGQRAVIQVVLNRVQAPGFPKTICGVVYQGHARTTGCQFSFTCDGSVRRRPVHKGWADARRAARRALAGRVFADVGRATHYHTDWMVPYWRDTLVKVAKVDTHLFYVRR
jgi:spore germination cell wall hydrolase CwlJ-like protein